jgi:hypothetical protein
MKITRAICATLALTLATPALADPAHDWEHAYWALSAIDAAETITCLQQHRCEEGNPIFGKHPSAFKLIAGKLAIGALHAVVFEKIYDRNPRSALRYAQFSVGLQAGVVGFNARIWIK